MKKKMCITLILITGFLAFFLLGKQVIKKENPNKPKVDLTVYTISSSDTQKWNAVKELETKEAIYPITVKEAASSEEIFSINY
ncbi:hypothetical protein DQ08_00550 [Streptococcus iniae]|uniref:Uncharacterized protein n=1 Tax=Streptococcus iniae TaxID=1346 RepID=A0ABM5QG30_STRIN|nr:hypothetical protein DQ08_00550 [Streptococcus iniae]